ncbi:MAG TPA: ABC transporter permease, partial [Chitinophaga sp.]
MFSSYFKMAWRSLVKDKFYTLLNVLGLALAAAAFLLIIYFVRFEYSYENFYRNAPNIVRITMDLYKGNEFVTTDCETHPPLAPLLKKDFPEVVDAVRIQMAEDIQLARVGNQRYTIEKAFLADPSIFNVFNYDFVEGNAGALDQPWQVVLTQTQARRLFGNGPVMGKTLYMIGHLFTVTGVIKDLPLNTHLKMNLLISFSTLAAMNWNMVTSWDGNNNYTYVQLRPG